MGTVPVDLAKATTRQPLVVSTLSYGFAHCKESHICEEKVYSHSVAFQGFNIIKNGQEQMNLA